MARTIRWMAISLSFVVAFAAAAASGQPPASAAKPKAGKPISKVLSGARPKAACVVPTSAISVSPPSFDFGTVAAGTQSPTQTFIVTNTGNRILDVGAIVAGPDFQVTSLCGETSIPPGGTCDIQARFNASGSPRGIGTAISIHSNAIGSPFDVPISGTVGAPTPAAMIDVTPSAGQNYGPVDVLTAGLTATYTVQNTGGVDLHVAGITSLYAPLIFPVGPGSCAAPPFTLAPTVSCTFTVGFLPIVVGFVDNYVEITSDASNQPTLYRYQYGVGLLAGSGFTSNPSSSSYPLSLGTINAGTVSDFFYVDVINPDLLPATIGAVTLGGSFAFQLDQGTCTPLTLLLSGESCYFAFYFDATSSGPGTFADLVTVTPFLTGTPLQIPVTVDVVTGISQLHWQMDPVAFGDVLVGNTGNATATLVNDDAISHTISIALLSGSPPFAIVSDNCGGMIMPMSTCTVDVSFTPTGNGAFSDSLYAMDETSTPFFTTLQGNGVPAGPRIAATPFEADFATVVAGTPSTLTIQLANIGDTSLNIASITPSDAPLTVSASTCATPVVPAGSCTFDLTMNAATPGFFAYFVTVVSDAPLGDFGINAFGFAAAAPVPIVDFEPSALTFPTPQTVGTTSAPLTVSLANVGFAGLSVSSIAVSGDFSLTNNCSAPLSANACCPLDVAFTPTAPGTRTGTATIVTNAGTVVVNLSGAAVAALPPMGAKNFAPSSIAATLTSVLTVTLTNPNTPFALTNAAFTDSYPPGLFNAAAPAPSTTCSGASVTAAPGGASFAFSGGTIPPGGTCTVSVVVTSSAVGASLVNTLAAGTITTAQANSALDASATLNVTAVPAPALSLAPPAIAFVAQSLGSTSGAQPVTITNTGSAALTFGASTTTGDFAGTTTCVGSLAPALSCTSSVTFTPTATGTRLGTYAIASNAPGSPHVVNLTGNGVATPIPGVALAPTAIVFGTQTAFTTSPAQTVTLTNTGTSALTIASVAVTGEFAVSSACGTSVAQGANCLLTVTFTPLLGGTRSGTVSVMSDAPGSPHTVTLSGTGVVAPSPNVMLSSTTVAFPPTVAGRSSAPFTVSVKNTGGAALAIRGIDVIGSAFTMVSNCGPTLGAGVICTLDFVFSPPSPGGFLADVRIITDAPGSPHFIRLSGTGTAAPVGRLDVPGTLAFSDQVVNTASAPVAFTITNAGSATVSVRRAATSGDYAVSGECFDLRAGESCAFSVTFTPTALGARQGQVVIESNASNPFAIVTLTGRGVPVPAPRLTLSASALGFGNRPAGAGSPQAVTATNTGGADLVISASVVVGDFRQSNDCPAVLRPGQSCRYDVNFAPSIPGARNGELRVFSNAAGSPGVVSLSGTGCRFFTVTASRTTTLLCGP